MEICRRARECGRYRRIAAGHIDFGNGSNVAGTVYDDAYLPAARNRAAFQTRGVWPRRAASEFLMALRSQRKQIGAFLRPTFENGSGHSRNRKSKPRYL